MRNDATFATVSTILTPFVEEPDALDKIEPSSRLLEDLGVNSARVIDVVLAFESEGLPVPRLDAYEATGMASRRFGASTVTRSATSAGSTTSNRCCPAFSIWYSARSA